MTGIAQMFHAELGRYLSVAAWQHWYNLDEHISAISDRMHTYLTMFFYHLARVGKPTFDRQESYDMPSLGDGEQLLALRSSTANERTIPLSFNESERI